MGYNSGLFHREKWKNNEGIACADCGKVCDLIGPFSFDGEIIEHGDMVCPTCAEERGVELKFCCCGGVYPEGKLCPGCGSYLSGG